MIGGLWPGFPLFAGVFTRNEQRAGIENRMGTRSRTDPAAVKGPTSAKFSTCYHVEKPLKAFKAGPVDLPRDGHQQSRKGAKPDFTRRRHQRIGFDEDDLALCPTRTPQHCCCHRIKGLSGTSQMHRGIGYPARREAAGEQ
jgi:hypothetical protein